MKASSDSFDVRERDLPSGYELDLHLGYAALASLSRKPWRELLVDRTEGRRSLSAGMLFGVAAALSRRWKGRLSGKRIGIVLPPGAGAAVANLAVVFLDKTPVNLNFTLGRAAGEACIQKCDIDTLISSPKMREKIPAFPWPDTFLDIREEIQACGKLRIFSWLLKTYLLPVNILARRLGVPREGGRSEAAMLCTSGSSGEPKAVVLSHRNILANVAQTHATGLLRAGDSLLGNLPWFHSFGFMATAWFPILQGARVVTVPSPLEVKKSIEAIKEENVTVLLGTPSFLRPYLKKAGRDDLVSLRLVIAGAEKTPPDLFQGFREKLGLTVLEGYGLTETSPVVSVNLLSDSGEGDGRRLRREGSAGRLLPGVTARIVHPETFEPLPPAERGMLLLRGPNVFEGYRNDAEQTKMAFHEEWYVTGDLARFDEDGFLMIEGRQSRFSKIGGEMVSHGFVEEKITEVFGWDPGDEIAVAVVGVSDEAKGEALVVLTAREVSREELRRKLIEAGLSNLWIPRKVKKVEKIPVLTSGKLDLRSCRELAEKDEDVSG